MSGDKNMEKLIFKNDSFYFKKDESFVAKLDELDSFDSLELYKAMDNNPTDLLEVLKEEYSFGLTFLDNNIEVGDVSLDVFSDEILSISVLSIKRGERRKGHGLKALALIKEFAKEVGFKSVRGECREELRDFYSKLGAKFESRLEEDDELMFNPFYYDLD
jgi:hypothetical protein